MQNVMADNSNFLRTGKLYDMMQTRFEGRSTPFSLLHLIVRVRDGLKEGHSFNVLNLYWYHIMKTDRPLYDRLKGCNDESTMRMHLNGKVKTAYLQGRKTIAICTDLFSPEFLEIIDAYLEYTDELAAARVTRGAVAPSS